jgi:predicted DNA-binding transcriptional regulator YafY
MPSKTYDLFREAILSEKQVVCSYEGRHRELCPHIIGTNKNGEEVVLAWQFAGESSGPLPQWRCLRLSEVSQARTRDGRWHAGGSHKAVQLCVSDIHLDINTPRAETITPSDLRYE